jgi:O-succinylbenzoic acid--CoA ligase
VEEARVIDWTSDESHLLLNPRLPAEERARLESLVIPLAAHVWLATSGTTGALKLTALSKRALLASAAAVNRHLGATANDVWGCVLPTFHVGGLGIHARAFLTGSHVLTLAWDPLAFASAPLTLSSLVPAQVSDLVRAGLHAPPSLRAIVVGGGALPDEMYEAARALGWPLLRSYGMTECCSQVATSTLDAPELVLLDHFVARAEEDGRLALRGDALLTGYAIEGRGFVDPKVDGWFVAEDRVELHGRHVRVLGRVGEFVKIGGESVDLARLDLILYALAGPDAALVAMPDERLGHVIHLATTRDAGDVVRAFNERVLPFERIRAVHRVAEIPRTPLGKLMRVRLLESLPPLPSASSS